jgi:putative ABC transport system substrate-binding protein
VGPARRDVLVASLLLPVAAPARPAHKPALIGILITGAPPNPLRDALQSGLARLGYAEGKDIVFDVRYANGSKDRAAELAAELVKAPVDVIVAHYTLAVRAARDATKTIPVVMAGAGAPLETGIVASLNHPGGNVTGLADLAAELGGRRIQLLKDIIPGLARVGALGSTQDLFTKSFLRYMQEAVDGSSVSLIPVLIDSPADFAMAFATLSQAQVQAVVIQGIFNPNRDAVLAEAAKYRMPVASWDHEMTRRGGLFSLVSDQAEVLRRTASFVDRILKGAKPGDLPVEQPTAFELLVNRRAAAARGLTVPQSVLALATEVIE